MTTITKAGVTLALAATLVGGSVARADTHSARGNLHMKVQIAANGKAMLRGTVAATTSSGFTLSTWGGTWNVQTASTTKFSLNSGISGVRAGDSIIVHGIVASTSDKTLLAAKVENKTLKEDTKEVRKGLHSSLFSFITGKIGMISGAGFTLNRGNATYTVNTTSDTRIYNRSWLPTLFGSLTAGSDVQVYGTKTGTTSVNASLIHNLSL